MLSSQPATCASLSVGSEALYGAGMALFNTPTLLGGQAAKAGLSCASCHINGRNNPHFLLAQVSGKAGTADVSNSFFSAARGNGLFDPTDIPDLTQAGKISHDERSGALELFIRNLIVEEFAGDEPGTASIDALAIYIRSIEDCGKRAPVEEPVKLEQPLDIIDEAVLGMKLMVQRDDKRGANKLIAAIRRQLGLISERFALAGLRRYRVMLLRESRDLATIMALEDTRATGQAVEKWKSRFDTETMRQLANAEGRSLFNPVRLRAVVAPQHKTR